MMGQYTTDTRSGTPFTPCLEDFRQTVVDTPVSRNRISALKRYGGNAAEVCKEICYHLFGSTLFLLNFTGGFSSGETHTSDCCFVSRSNWYAQISSPVTMTQTRGDFPPSNYPASALHSGHGAPNGHNVSLRQGGREEYE